MAYVCCPRRSVRQVTGVAVARNGKSTMRTERREHADGDPETWEVPLSHFTAFILYAVLAGFLALVSLNTYASGAPATQMTTCVLCFSALCAFQILQTQPRSEQRGRRYRTIALSAQVLLTYLPLPWLGNPWEAVGGFLAASVLLLLPARLKWQVFFAVVAANTVIAELFNNEPAFVVSTALSTLATGLALYSIRLVSELRRARTRLIGAISQERRRFARDLHDLLGYSLSAIALKTEVAMRSVPRRDEQVQKELTSILAISRQALTDVRHVAHSYQSLSLATELKACVAMLRSASIEVDVRTSVPPPENQTGTVLAVVLREAVTNMLRHSKVQHCVIELDRVGRRLRLGIVNDGTELVGRDDVASSSTASTGCRGLTNLEMRLAAVGGTLTAGRRSGGRFEVVAGVPDSCETPEPSSAARDDGSRDGRRGDRRPVGHGGRAWYAEHERHGEGDCARRRDLRGVQTDPNRTPGGTEARCDHLGSWEHVCSTPVPRGLPAEP
ncbi:sensor histidine kinase [Streptomyces sp. NPDC017179]|uniref:sensor histidine kinase n=1 Tax=Streptomyces sp. NPDC017179 TaxID=3364979 RepID=UPI0037BD3DC7